MARYVNGKLVSEKQVKAMKAVDNYANTMRHKARASKGIVENPNDFSEFYHMHNAFWGGPVNKKFSGDGVGFHNTVVGDHIVKGVRKGLDPVLPKNDGLKKEIENKGTHVIKFGANEMWEGDMPGAKKLAKKLDLVADVNIHDYKYGGNTWGMNVYGTDKNLKKFKNQYNHGELQQHKIKRNKYGE